ncbi:hypothetical protein HII31_13317 [Pseudocercospora fuligena]|uniref:Uncharacterized protein n=1 Tax=Pseudocercospora fuligena TaxID=685502 RepID=A0A8H6VAR9_9PEZI|nr:hypothetical protein HII31_13317 [Pseudocercospora fuligena]
MESEPNLAALPAELQVEIAQLLEEDQDIRALRATSRTLAVNCTDLFAERFFQRRSHLYTMHGLEALRDISRKPVFARHVKHVELVVVDIDDQDEAFQEDIESRTGVHLAATEEAERWCRAEQARRQRCDYGLLHQALENFKRLGVAKDIKVTANLWMHKPPALPVNARRVDVEKALLDTHGGVFGVKAFLRNIKPWAEVSDICADGIDEAVESLLLASTRTKHNVEVLDLGFRSIDGLCCSFLPFDHLNNEDEYDEMWELFGRLKKLRLGFHHSSTKWGEVKMLRSAVNIEELSISMNGTCPGDARTLSHMPLALDLGASNLKRLALSHATVTAQGVTSLLSRYKDSLEDLHLSEIALSKDDDWFELLRWIHDELTQLSTFTACRLLVDQNDSDEDIYVATSNLSHTAFKCECRDLFELAQGGQYLGTEEKNGLAFDDHRTFFFNDW